jgi:tetratricopeptide (TPR) repeat protein
MLSRRARKTLHVAAARHLEQSWPGELRDIAEVLASHYQEAIAAEPDADDVAELRASARERLTAAGQAAASLALGPEADRYFEQAAELAEDDLERAGLLERAGRALWQSGDPPAGEQRLRRAIELYELSSESGGSAAVALSYLLRFQGRLDEALVLIEPFRAPDAGRDPVVRAEALAELAAALIFGGDVQKAGSLLEEALLTLELEEAWPRLANALITRAIYLIFEHRLQEGAAVLRHALALAEEYDLPGIVLRSRFNLAAIALERDRFGEAIEEVERGLLLARERGDRSQERHLLTQMVFPLYFLGRWDEAADTGAAVIAGALDADAVFAAASLAQIAAGRGAEEMMGQCLLIAGELRDSNYNDQRVSAELVLARDALERGAPDQALEITRPIAQQRLTGGETVDEAYALSVEAAIALADEKEISELVEQVSGLPPARATPLLRAGRARLQAEQAHRRGDAEEARRYEDQAIQLLRSVGARPLLARALLERARRHADPEALVEARAIYAELGATRWLERIGQQSEVVA